MSNEMFYTAFAMAYAEALGGREDRVLLDQADRDAIDAVVKSAIMLAAQHVEAQHVVWDHAGIPTAHVIQTLANGIRALS